MAETADDWGVSVNECGIFASHRAAGWWAEQTIHILPRLVTTFEQTPQGNSLHVLAGTREDAEFMHDHMIDKGVHRTHVKIQRLSAAKTAYERREAKRATDRQHHAELVTEHYATTGS